MEWHKHEKAVLLGPDSPGCFELTEFTAPAELLSHVCATPFCASFFSPELTCLTKPHELLYIPAPNLLILLTYADTHVQEYKEVHGAL